MELDELRKMMNVDRELKRMRDLGAYSYTRFKGKEKEPLDAAEEIDTYVHSWDPFLKENIETYHEDMSSEPLPENLSAYVIMPVIAGQEIDTLRRTLLQYEKQDADPSTWSLLLFVNNTDTMTTLGTSHQAIDQTYNIINEFIERNPQLSIRTMYTTYIDEAPPIGEIRSDAWDTALYDVSLNNLAHNNLIGISHDADTEWLSPDYISKMQQAARDNPLADLLTCQLSWQNDGDYQSDANKILRYWEYLGAAQRHKLGEFGASDANTAIRFGSYAAISGFKRGQRLAEMIDIRERLNIARGNDKRSTNNLCYVEGIRLKTNSRRIYRAIAAGYSPDYAWDSSLPFLTGEDPVRELDTTALANKKLGEEALHVILDSMDDINLWKLKKRDTIQKVGRAIIRLPTKKIAMPSVGATC